MKGFVKDIESISVKNEDFCQVLYTAKNCQLVVMALKPKEEIGMKRTSSISSFAWKKGWTRLFLVHTAIKADFAVLVPAGANHKVVNTGNVPLKLYTLYVPPNHRDGLVHHTYAKAEKDNKHFDGKTTE